MAVANRPSPAPLHMAMAMWKDSSTLRTVVSLALAIPAFLIALFLPLQIVLVTAIVLGVIAFFSRNLVVQRIAFQVAFAATIVLVGRVLISNLITELDKKNFTALPFVELGGSFPFVDFKLDFLGQRAGFGIAETSFGREYTANNSYGEAYLAGLLNTLRVAILGIVLASAVGLTVGVARLSNNWLLSKLATVYVETFRNVPLLVQLIFWYTVVILRLPKIDEDASFLNIILISNRSIALPWATAEEGFGLWSLLLLGAAGFSAIVWYIRNHSQVVMGRPTHPWWSAAAVFVVLGAVAFIVTGAPLSPDQPELIGRSYEGGVRITPEFTALLLGLTIYTGAFIAEVVRGSLQAIEKGQTEAASALGLSALQRLRLVVLPQAMRIMIPPLTNQYLNLVKNSSLGVAVAFPDLFRITRITINQSGQAIPMILLVMATYLAMSLLISLIMNVMNSRIQVPTR